MNQEIKKLWVDALRSGEYKQSKLCLRDTKGFCCLGVLSDLYIKQHDDAKWEKLEDDTERRYEFKDSERFEVFYLPVPVVKWAGLKSSNPLAGKENLSCYNDKGMPFEQIANLIDFNL